MAGQALRTAGAVLVAVLVAVLSLGGRGLPAVERPGWVASGSLAAPEAVQAAAADQDFVYAISNRQVARYDRRTGQRTGLSRGEAEHLNSGFLWNGRLYCAHSNYPHRPEQSQIKVLDPETLELSTFKDFGDYGGSLTWAVRHAGHWWCNFAHYGDQNERTFLVKLTEQFQEVGRWTYPAEVISQLGRYSLSGGIWHEGDLLVSGHDDPVVFRLRLPDQGAVLQLIDRLPVPFTGQGFALDPRTGGLVGIHRGQRKVLFATHPQPASNREPTRHRLRILSYNIHHAEGVDGKLDLERIARVITAAKPDLVALQEVDRGTARTGQVDQPRELARLTGMQVAFGGNIRFQGGDYGNAVLSRLAIREQRNHLLPSLDEGEQRGVLEVRVELPGRAGTLLFLATHLDHRPADRERLASVRAIQELLDDEHRRRLPAVLAGDLNDVPGSATLQGLSTTWRIANSQPRPTVPVGDPQRQIDYVLVRPAARWEVVEVQVLDEAVASDHRAILAVLELRPAADE